jgi:hypothetical protein
MPPMSASNSAETFGRQQDCAIANANTSESRHGASTLSSPIEQARLRQAQREQKTIVIAQVRSLRHSPAKNIDLLSKDQDFGLEVCSRFEK